MSEAPLREGTPEYSMFIPAYCRARCALEYPYLGVGSADAGLLRSIRADFSAARRADCTLYALRERLVLKSAGRYLMTHPKAALVDIGCGLSTTLRELETEGCRYYVDLPEAIRLRNRLIPIADNERCISLDVREREIDGIPAGDGVFFVMAGLLCHLWEDEAAALLRCLARRYPGAGMAFDGVGLKGRLRSSLPKEQRLREITGLGGVKRVTGLPEEFGRLPAQKRLKLSLLLKSGQLRFYEVV